MGFLKIEAVSCTITKLHIITVILHYFNFLGPWVCLFKLVNYMNVPRGPTSSKLWRINNLVIVHTILWLIVH